MTIRTPLCDMLGIKYPIMLAGMGGVSYGELAAAVSSAGGFGTLGMAGRSPDEIKNEMRIVRDLTDKPFGVDLLAAVPEVPGTHRRYHHRRRCKGLHLRPGRSTPTSGQEIP